MSEAPEQIEYLQSKLEALEVKVAYQEDTIDALNTSVIKQQDMLDKQTRLMEKLVEKVQSMEGDTMAGGQEVELPPHY